MAMRAHWRRLRDSGKAAAYLRQCVVNRSRSVLRHHRVADRNARQLLPDMPSAEEGVLALLERSAVVAALHALPAKQREVVVLRYYANLSGPQIASVMGITPGSGGISDRAATAALIQPTASCLPAPCRPAWSREVSLVILRCTQSVSYDKTILVGNRHTLRRRRRGWVCGLAMAIQSVTAMR